MSDKQWIGGVHAVQMALDDGRVESLDVVADKRSKKVLGVLAAAQAVGITIHEVERYQLDLRLPGVRHQGVAALCRPAEGAANWQAAIAGRENPLILVLDGIQDPHNLGACLRSALAANVDAVLLPNSRSAEITPAVANVSCGASEVLPIFQVANLKREVQQMKEKGLWVVGGAGEEAQSLYDVTLNLPLVLILGSEGEGIRFGLRELCDYRVAIPMNPAMESLNVSVACGVMLFEAVRQRQIRPA